MASRGALVSGRLRQISRHAKQLIHELRRFGYINLNTEPRKLTESYVRVLSQYATTLDILAKRSEYHVLTDSSRTGGLIKEIHQQSRDLFSMIEGILSPPQQDPHFVSLEPTLQSLSTSRGQFVVNVERLKSACTILLKALKDGYLGSEINV